MQVRSIPLLATGVVFLLAAALLGAVMVHDGAVGTDEALLDRVDAGDEVRLRGDAVPCCHPTLQPWLRNHSVELTGDDVRVIVTSDDPLPTGEIVVDGEVLHVGVDPRAPQVRVVVVWAHSVSEPIVFG